MGLISGLIGSGTLPLQAQPVSPKPELLQQTLERYRQTRGMQAHFQQHITIPVLDKEKTSTGIWRFQDHRQWSLTFEDPKNDRVVADGQYVWLYYPSSHPGQVIRQTLQKRLPESSRASPERWLQQVLGEGYQLVDIQTRTDQASEVQFRFRARSENSLSPEVVLQVDSQRKLLTRVRWSEYTGTQRQIRFSHIQPDVSFPAGQFRFEPPEGVDIFRANNLHGEDAP